MAAFRCPSCGTTINSADPVGSAVARPFCRQRAIVPAPGAPVGVGGSIPTGYAMTLSPRTGLAIAALVCGLLGMLCIFLLGLLGVILGIVALARASREPQTHGGRGMAIAGICTGGRQRRFHRWDRGIHQAPRTRPRAGATDRAENRRTRRENPVRRISGVGPIVAMRAARG